MSGAVHSWPGEKPVSISILRRRRMLGSLGAWASSTCWLFAVTALVLFVSDESRAQERVSDKEIYHLAVDYCRGPLPRPMALSAGQMLICFDGWIDDGMDLSSVRGLKDHGLFVVRSLGGHAETTITLSNLLRDRHATVVVYDYCMAACADFLFVASDQSYVLADALVAWRDPLAGLADCTSLKTPRDDGPKRVESVPCPDATSAELHKYEAAVSAVDGFYSERVADPKFERPPISFDIRRSVVQLYRETGVYPKVTWTLSPRYNGAFRTNIFYEAYPKSQEEVDAIAARLHLGRVIYDP
ncbi:hypothetical protein [Bradyrhizobium sp. HKCCYLS1011]|uniref:hypothetical protein n=1 Tax=Bradyrhizobium sp. HKCCYLS1011 TaxID=3420733 RepID=UPI003EBDF34D